MKNTEWIEKTFKMNKKHYDAFVMASIKESKETAREFNDKNIILCKRDAQIITEVYLLSIIDEALKRHQ